MSYLQPLSEEEFFGIVRKAEEGARAIALDSDRRWMASIEAGVISFDAEAQAGLQWRLTFGCNGQGLPSGGNACLTVQHESIVGVAYLALRMARAIALTFGNSGVIEQLTALLERARRTAPDVQQVIASRAATVIRRTKIK